MLPDTNNVRYKHDFIKFTFTPTIVSYPLYHTHIRESIKPIMEIKLERDRRLKYPFRTIFIPLVSNISLEF